jgi:CheY-like chemotaxis protein/anti-sigma regulatory factor (Ser/Thr protein kinase)
MEVPRGSDAVPQTPPRRRRRRAPHTVARPDAAAGPSRPSPIRTVIADDDPDVRFLLRRHLERTGMFTIVAEAADGLEAVAAATHHQPELTLLDLKMGPADGLTALPQIRRRAPDCIVIVVSQLPAADAREGALAAGAQDYLTKSPRWDELVEELLPMVRGATESGAGPAERRIRLPASVTSSSYARSFVQDAVRRWNLEPLLEDAVLLTSELVSNAVLHARTAVELRVRQIAHGLRVEVIDSGGGALVMRAATEEDTSGRGLFFVETLATAWGTATVQPHGKRVWFELDVPA